MRERWRTAPQGAGAVVVYYTERAPSAQGSLPSVVELELLLSILRGLRGETTEYEHGSERARVPEKTPRKRERKDTHAGAKGHARGSERTDARERKDIRMNMGASAGGPEYRRSGGKTHAKGH